MRRDLGVVAAKLSGPEDPLESAAAVVEKFLAGSGENAPSSKEEAALASGSVVRA